MKECSTKSMVVLIQRLKGTNKRETVYLLYIYINKTNIYIYIFAGFDLPGKSWRCQGRPFSPSKQRRCAAATKTSHACGAIGVTTVFRPHPVEEEILLHTDRSTPRLFMVLWWFPSVVLGRIFSSSTGDRLCEPESRAPSDCVSLVDTP